MPNDGTKQIDGDPCMHVGVRYHALTDVAARGVFYSLMSDHTSLASLQYSY